MKGANIPKSPYMYDARGTIEHFYDVTACVPSTSACKTFKTFIRDNPRCIGDNMVVIADGAMEMSVLAFNPMTNVYEFPAGLDMKDRNLYCVNGADVAKASPDPMPDRTVPHVHNGQTFFCQATAIGHGGFCFQKGRFEMQDAADCLLDGSWLKGGNSKCVNANVLNQRSVIKGVYAKHSSNLSSRNLWPQAYFDSMKELGDLMDAGMISDGDYEARAAAVSNRHRAQMEERRKVAEANRAKDLEPYPLAAPIVQASVRAPRMHPIFDPPTMEARPTITPYYCKNQDHMILDANDAGRHCVTIDQLRSASFPFESSGCDSMYGGGCWLGSTRQEQ